AVECEADAADRPDGVGPAAQPPSPGERLLAARTAISGRRWRDAVAAFAEADAADELLPADLEEWALALERCGPPGEAMRLLTRAVAAYSTAGLRLRAAGPSVRLVRLHLERGELAVAKGWCKRAAELIGAASDSRESGLWCWVAARTAGAEGDPERA